MAAAIATGSGRASMDRNDRRLDSDKGTVYAQLFAALSTAKQTEDVQKWISPASIRRSGLITVTYQERAERPDSDARWRRVQMFNKEAPVAKIDVERLAKLVRDRESFLSTHKTLMEAFKATKSPQIKEMASQALDEAGKRDDRIAQIIGEHKKNGKTSG
jgi:hypothetical protein